MSETVKPRRAYDNRPRAEQARATQRRIVEVARQQLLERGYAGTTMAGVAGAAGVSVESVYKAFGSKAALVKRVWDVTLVGDDQPVPLRERPEFQAMLAEPDPRRKVALYAKLGRLLVARLGPLLGVVLAGARAGDPELQALVATLDRERLVGTSGVVAHLAEAGALRPGLDVERARDILWTLIAPEVYSLLVVERGWSLDDYEAWLATTMADALLGPGSSTPAAARVEP